ncbi:MAG TPA: SRPBCC domain-containing protein [Thermodesulfovibrionales bacterium]|nr:SRPBCC domain-containing protein [Thermodesulfovibrionales bacterium]
MFAACSFIEVEDLLIVRVFTAPRKLVWKAWTDAELMKRWWGPKGFTTLFNKIDLRVNGTYLNCMRSPEGRDYWSTGTYRAIAEPERIALTDSFADEKGNVVPATYYGMASDFPLEIPVEVTFEAYDGNTKLTLRHVGIPPGAERDATEQGWAESLYKLADVLKRLR